MNWNKKRDKYLALCILLCKFLNVDFFICLRMADGLLHALGHWYVNAHYAYKCGTHCKKATAPAMSVLGMIRRTFPFVDADGFKLLYNVYIWPHFEFCVQARSLYFKKVIDRMEKVGASVHHLKWFMVSRT